MGFPLRITVGPRSLKDEKIEIRLRGDGTVWLVDRAEVVARVQAELGGARQQQRQQ